MVGVTTALYTNWLIAIADKLDAEKLTNGAMAFILSLIILVFYFSESFRAIKEQTWVKGMPMKIVLGLAHILLVFVGLLVDGVYQSNYVFSSIGGFL